MSVFGNNEELVDKIKAQVSQIKLDSLSVEEFEQLLNNTRELYERILLLRYKAFENHFVNTIAEKTAEEILVEEKTVEITTTIEIAHEEEIIEQTTANENEQEEPFAFSLFGEIEDDKPIDKSEESKAIENIQPEIIVGSKTVSFTETESTSLLEKLSEQSNTNRLSDKLKLTRVESLSAIFTLNDRIRFSQGLFKGNNDAFQHVVNTLDGCDSKESAMDLLKKYSTEFAWDMESKDVEHFYEFVERLYV